MADWTKAKLEKARANFKAWHDKHPTETVEEQYTFPDYVYRCGRIVEMIYESDKWEEDGDMYPYIHEFESKPPVFCLEESEVFEPADAPRSVRDLLCVRDLDGDVPLTMLAFVSEVTLEFSGGEKQRFHFKNTPVMAGTLDNRTLVVFHDKGPIFISGGAMRITPRGIVN